jgi:hypothetical protein
MSLRLTTTFVAHLDFLVSLHLTTTVDFGVRRP